MLSLNFVLGREVRAQYLHDVTMLFRLAATFHATVVFLDEQREFIERRFGSAVVHFVHRSVLRAGVQLKFAVTVAANFGFGVQRLGMTVDAVKLIQQKSC